MSNTRKSVSSDMETLRRGLKKTKRGPVFLTNFERLFRVFDIASQNINNSYRNSNQKFTAFYDN